MKNLLKNITRNISSITPFNEGVMEFTIVLDPVMQEKPIQSEFDGLQLNKTYNLKVKDYMTRKATLNFNFMRQWNNNIPLPSTNISGKITKETKGMIFLENELGKWWIIRSAIIESEEI